MGEWVLILLVFTAGDTSPAGKVMGGLPSEQACLAQAKKDTPRVRQLYPPPRYEQFQWVCERREALGAAPKTQPSV